MACIYRHIRLDTETPFYIGIGVNPRRAYSKYSRSEFWKNVALKHGFEVEILMNNISWEQATEKEKEFIKLYGRLDNKTGILVNLTDGGDGALGIIQSEESKEKKRQSNKNRVFTEETRKKLSEKQMGEKNHMYGRVGLLNPSYGIKRSEKTRKKISEIAKKRGPEKNPMFGKKHSDETKEKIRIKRLMNKITRSEKKVGCFIGGKLVKKYNSMTEASKDTGSPLSCISMCCSGRMKTSKGFEWKYLNV